MLNNFADINIHKAANSTCGKELEYRIIAVNKAGDGEPSNTAMVVL